MAEWISETAGVHKHWSSHTNHNIDSARSIFRRISDQIKAIISKIYYKNACEHGVCISSEMVVIINRNMTNTTVEQHFGHTQKTELYLLIILIKLSKKNGAKFDQTHTHQARIHQSISEKKEQAERTSGEEHTKNGCNMKPKLKWQQQK